MPDAKRHPELIDSLTGLLAIVRAAIAAGDWKVDGACDPEAALARADSAIAMVEGRA